MIALYGTQTRYSLDVLTYGVRRDSAAVFLLPDQPEWAMTRRTLACAVYHALGLSLLREAVQSGRNLRSILEEETGGVCLVYMRNIMLGEWSTNRYALKEGETYPYVKLKDCGPLNAQEKLSVCLSPFFFDERIDGEDGRDGYRFFQKTAGTPQWLHGCNMQILKRICMDGAEHSLRTVSVFLFGNDADYEGS